MVGDTTVDAGMRHLTTVMFTDIVASTRTASALGDRAWRGLLDQHNDALRQAINSHAGEVLDTNGDGFMAVFARPHQAIACALDATEAVRSLGLEIRAGIHTGECERRGQELAGIAVHIAARVVAEARPSQVLVSSTVRDLVVGSDIAFASTGAHVLKGVPGRHRLFAAGPVAAGTVAGLPNRPEATPRSLPRGLTASRRERRTARPAKPVPRERLLVLVADDHPLWRQTLADVLEDSGVARSVVEASDGTEAVAMAASTRPDVIVLDMDMPRQNGVETTRALVAQDATARVLILSSSDEPAKVLAAIKAGALGYMLKTADSTEIVQAVRRVHAGEAVIPTALAGTVLGQLRAPAPAPADPLSNLSPREREVLALVAEGHSNQAIGDRLHTSLKSVEAHMSVVFNKLGLDEGPESNRRVQAAVFYLRSTGFSRDNPAQV